MPRNSARGSRPRSRPAPAERPSPPEVDLYATTAPGLEDLLREEVESAGLARQVGLVKGRVTFSAVGAPPLPLPLLACDRAGLVVRTAHGDFTGLRGLTELRGKLARTEFDRALAALAALGVEKPRTFKVVAEVAPACDFMFFDVKREGTPIIASRLGLELSEEQPDVLVDVQVLPDAAHVGLELPLVSWAAAAKPARVPRSLVGAVIRLAGPAPRLTACDPDCGAGELLGAWRAVAGPGRVIGLGARPPARPQPTRRVPGVAVAIPRVWPIADARLSRVFSLNPRLRTPVDFAKLADETARCLAPGGRAVFLVPGDQDLLRALEAQPSLTVERTILLRDREESRRLVVLRREGKAPGHHTPTTAGDRARATRELGGVVSRRQRSWRPPSKSEPSRGGRPSPKRKSRKP